MIHRLRLLQISAVLCGAVTFSVLDRVHGFVSPTKGHNSILNQRQEILELFSTVAAPKQATAVKARNNGPKGKSKGQNRKNFRNRNKKRGAAKKTTEQARSTNNGNDKYNSKSKLSRTERNTQYMVRRWKSQQLEEKKKRKVTESGDDGLVNIVGVSVEKLNSSKKNGGKKKSNSRTTKGQPAVTGQKRNNKTTKKSKNGQRKQEKKEMKSWMELSPGSLVSGKVIKVLPYGALVQTEYDIPGKTHGCAMLHISQISNEKIEDVSEYVKVGQEIKDARVVSLNREEGRAAISLRQKTQRAISLETLRVGDEVEGKVVRMKKYGVFVDVGCRRNALLHISRMSLYKVVDMTDHVNIGDTVKVRVIRIDPDQKNIAVSMLSPENDKFVDRRDMQKQRMNLWQQIVNAQDEDMEDTKKQLLELDRAIWDDFQASLGTPRSIEV